MHGAKLCVVPHPDNDHKPWAMRHGALGFVSGLLIAAKLLTVFMITLVPAQAHLSTITSARIIQLTNAERAKVGLGPLSPNSALTSAAQKKGNDMIEFNYFAHVSPTGVTPWFWIQQAGYTYQVAGENLAIDFSEAEDVVAAWMASPSHKANILHPDFTQTGVAVATGEFEGRQAIVIVHHFGLPTGTNPSDQAVPQEPVSEPVPKPAPAKLEEPGAEPLPVPRISLISETSFVKEQIQLALSGEPNTTVHLLLNNEQLEEVRLGSGGSIEHTLSLEDVPDSALTLRAYASQSGRGTSPLSDSLFFTKDVTPPDLGSDMAWFIDPATDLRRVALELPEIAGTRYRFAEQSLDTEDWVTLPVGTLDTLLATDEAGNEQLVVTRSLTPDFVTERVSGDLIAPSRLRILSRHMILIVAGLLLLLLVSAIGIRWRIQHPPLIAHGTAVFLLAVALLFV